MTEPTEIIIPHLSELSPHPAWDDTECYTAVIKKVKPSENGFEISRTDGYSFFLFTKDFEEPNLPEPRPDDTVTFWGRLFGPHRGVALNSIVLFYRTKEQNKVYRDEQTYGKSAQEWLDRWDEGRGVWTIQVGGLSAGYDQCINLYAAEVLRALLETQPDTTIPQMVRDRVDELTKEAASTLGLSGAQYGAAVNLAISMYVFGPVKMIQSYPEERRTQASKTYPTLDPEILALLKKRAETQN